MRTDKNVSPNSFRRSKQWRTNPLENAYVPEIDRRLQGAEYINGRMVVHSLSGNERNHLFVNGHQEFSDLSLISGLDNPADSRGFATIDFDRDGMQDIAMVNANSPLLNLYKNQLANRAISAASNYVAIRFVGANSTSSPNASRKSCRDGYGAMVELTVGNSVLKREHRCGEGYGSQNSATMIVGIGQATSADQVQVRWPSGATHRIDNVPSGTLITQFEDKLQSPNQTNFVSEPYQREADRNLSTPLNQDPTRFVLGPSPSIPIQSLNSGKLRVYVSMATWCTACIQHLPDIEQISTTMANEVEIIGIPIDESEDANRLRDFASTHQPRFRLILHLTPKQRTIVNQSFASITPHDVLPSTVVTDPRGKILLKTAGIPSVSDIRKASAKSASEF